MNITEQFIEDVVKLAAFKMKRRKKKKSTQYRIPRDVSNAGSALTGGVLASIMNDIRETPVSTIKSRLYDLADSAARHMFSR